MRERIHEYEELLIVAVLLLGNETYKHKRRGKENTGLTREGIGGVMTEITNERTDVWRAERWDASPV